jgi:hypothetical protein
MSLHLFSTPTECTHCGTVVDDPTVDRCPNCKALLRERRSPHRVAGVPSRYGSVRILLAALRFMGVVVVALGVLVFFSALGDDGFADVQAGLILVGSLLAAIAMFALASFFDVAMDIEENTRASFRLQQFILEELQMPERGTDQEGARRSARTGSVPVEAPPERAGEGSRDGVTVDRGEA